MRGFRKGKSVQEYTAQASVIINDSYIDLEKSYTVKGLVSRNDIEF